MKTLRLSIAASLLLLGFSSCKKDKGNANLQYSMKMNTSAITKSSSNNSLQFSSGSVTIREIIFDGEHKVDGSLSETEQQITTINLVTGAASPSISTIIPAGEYNSINLGIELQDNGNEPNIVAFGTWTNAAGNRIPVKFEFFSGEVFEAEASSHTFESDGDPIAEISFSPSDWFSTITATMLNDADITNDTLFVNPSSNSDIFDIVADKLDDKTQATFR